MKHRVLILGAGFWGGRWIELIRACERTELAGVACDPAAVEAVCGRFGLCGAAVYPDYREAVERADAEIMVNVLPAALHFDADRRALERGMHVIAEKPLVASMEEAAQLLEIASARPGQRFMASQNYRWRPHNMAIRAALDEGRIGALESISLEFRQQEDLQGYRGGLARPLLDDMAIHHFDLLRYFSGADCAEICARAWRPSWSLYPGQPNLDAILTMENGVHVSYTGTWAARGRQSSWDGNLVLTGSEGCLTLDVENRVYFYPHKKDASVVLDTACQQGELLPNAEMAYTEMEYGLRGFLDCIEEGRVPETTLADNFKSFSMVDACRRAAEQGCAIRL